MADAHAAIDALQRELLPPGVPVVPGLEIAASYLLADAGTAAGGDWFDATPLPDGRVALVVGDVVGHGVVERVATQTLELLTRETGHADDITLLAAQRLPAPPDLLLERRADAGSLADVRAQLGGWLRAAAVPETDAHAVQHAVGELVANVVDHAYARTGSPGTVEVRASLAATGLLHIQVRDHGRWVEPRTAPEAGRRRGRGLWMVAQLVDDFVLDHPDGATEAYVVHRPSRPARVRTAGTLTGRPVDQPTGADTTLAVDDRTDGVLRVSGPLDSATATRVAAAITQASAAGTRPLLVDLTDVTHLASAGVSVLYDADVRSLGNFVGLALHAAAGSPADQVLTLVALEHTTDATQDWRPPSSTPPCRAPSGRRRTAVNHDRQRATATRTATTAQPREGRTRRSSGTGEDNA